MNGDVVGYIVGGIVTLAASYIAARSSRQASRTTAAAKKELDEAKAEREERRVEGEAYDRAESINRGIVEALTEDLARVKSQAAEDRAAAHTEMDSLRAELHRERETTAGLASTVARLQGAVATLEQVLHEHHIEVPASVRHHPRAPRTGG